MFERLPFNQGLKDIGSAEFAVLLGTLLVAGVAYVVLRYRDAHNPVKDAHIGIKTVLHCFLSSSVFLMLIGGSTVLNDVMTKKLREELTRPVLAEKPKDKQQEEFLTDNVRRGLATATTGGMFALLTFIILLMGTNDLRWPMVRRVFVGYRFAIHFVMVIMLTSRLVELSFMREITQAAGGRDADTLKKERELQFLDNISYLAVWGASWLLHLILIRLYSAQSVVPASRGDGEESAEVRPVAPPPPPPRRRPM